MSALLSFFSIFLLLFKATWATNYSLPFSTYLDANQQVKLKWGFDNPQGNITFQLTINTTGWLGFGFSLNGGMHNADIVMGGIGANGSYFKDYFATGEVMPVVDAQQSYTLLSMTEADGQTVMTFQRPMITPDSYDYVITNQPINLIYAYGNTDTIQYHGARRGHKQVNLLSSGGSTGTTWATNYSLPFSTYLDANQQVKLKWGFDNPQGNITFQLTINTTGWLGFGFSANGGMHNADIVMGGVGSNGSYFKDYFATGEVMPVVDTQQSYSLLSMTEADGQTVMTFQRHMNTLDSQDFVITNQPINLIYAYGNTDTIQYHGARRGHKQVNLLSSGGSTGTTWATNYSLPFSTYLDANQQVKLKWGFDNPQGNITFQLTINTTGWLGFGFSANGGMDNADIVMGGVGSNENYFKDYFATGEVMPVVDTQQSYSLLSMTEADGQTVMTFQRPMNTLDSQDYLITNQPINLIYAYGNTDTIQYHGARRGHKQVNLLSSGGSTETTSDPGYKLSYSTNLDASKVVNLKWGFDNPQGNITFQLTINTLGWLGFGFSPKGGMDDADIVMGGVGSSGNYFKDYFAPGEVMPTVDAQQSYTLLSMTEADGQTVMTFQRPMNTLDSKDFVITDQPIHLIYAYGETDEIKYHSNRRGHKQVNLLRPESAASRFCTSWIVNAGGFLLLLIWTDII